MSSSSLHPAEEHLPGLSFEAPYRQSSRQRAWRVIHACEHARDVLAVAEGQVSVGMLPYIVTPQGAGAAEMYLTGTSTEQSRPLSLLRSWQDVRNWRKSILDCDPENSADILHAHSFASGMAAVRSTAGVVYDFSSCIEELAISLDQCEPGSWMARSFRVAEQFILSRAAAVVVHSSSMRSAAHERGTQKENIFLIPDPLPVEDSPLPDFVPPAENSRFGISDGDVTFFVPQLALNRERTNTTMAVLEAFSQAVRENPEFRLLLGVDASHALRNAVLESAKRLACEDYTILIETEACQAAWNCAQVIIADCTDPADPVIARRPSEICLHAMSRGKALLAADISRNRDVSPDGRGCLWFSPDDVRDLASRITFIGRNPEFRRALAAAGQSFLIEARNSTAIGEKYRNVYRYAFARKRTTGPGAGLASLQPAANWG